MKGESIVFALAGMLFGVIVGWILGDQQARQAAPSPVVQQSSADTGGEGGQAPLLDENRVAALSTIAQNDDSNLDARAQLGNLYFDAQRFQEAIAWYEAALKLDPNNVNVSTDLGVSYYYTNQPDRALAQFDRSLSVEPAHVKTLLNQGIVLAFGKGDLKEAIVAWERVVEVAPTSPEAAAATQALERLKTAHDPSAAAAPGG